MTTMNTLEVFILFIAISYTLEDTPICDAICKCTEDHTADCNRAHLNVIPNVDMWPKNLKSLDLSGNNISAVDVEMTHENLETLNLSRNKIKTINASVFGGLYRLKRLDLSQNEVIELVQNTFYGLEGMKSLDISHNKLHSLPEGIFNGLFQMQELRISNNEIVQFNRQHLNKMYELKTLDMSNIGAYSLPSDLFHDFKYLYRLDLSQNEFPEVPTDSIRSARNLSELMLNGNPIHELNKKSFLGMKNLKVLKISFSDELVKVDENTFSPLISLKSLELTHNKKLSFIHPDAFKGLFQNSSSQNLTEINLESNQLSALSKIPCRKLSKLNLQRNPWSCDCSFRWIRSCMIEEIYAADFKCMTPRHLRSQLIVQTPEVDFKCEIARSEAAEEIHHNRMIRTISLALGCASLLVLGSLILLVLKWRSIRWWWHNRRKGIGAVYYVRANPGQEL